MSSSPPLDQPRLTIDDIDSGVTAVENVQAPGARDLLEQAEAEKAQLGNKLARSHIKNVKADRRMRKTYAGRILRYLELYSVGVLILVIFAGFRLGGFALQEGVLAALVGSTAIAAIGLVGFIARGLFQPPPSN